jgi:hypothetical protein
VGAKKLTPFRGVSKAKKAEGEKKDNLIILKMTITPKLIFGSEKVQKNVFHHICLR